MCSRVDRSGQGQHHTFNYGAQYVYGAALKRFPSFAAMINRDLVYSKTKGLPAGWGEEKMVVSKEKNGNAGGDGKDSEKINMNLNFDWVDDSKSEFDGMNGFVFQPNMSTLPKLMEESAKSQSQGSVSVHTSALVDGVTIDAQGQWNLSIKNTKISDENKSGVKRIETFEHVVIAVPSPQASSLLSISNYEKKDDCIKDLNKVVYDPCWVLMLSFSNFPYKPFETQGLFMNPSPSIAMVSNETSRIQDVNSIPNVTTLTILASSSWSRANLEESNAKVEENLLTELKNITAIQIPSDAKLLTRRSHRWRYSRVVDTMQTSLPFIYDDKAKIGLCGDYFLGPNIEHALDSGDKLAQTIVNSSNK